MDYAGTNISVAILPQTGPVLEGIRQNYQIGDNLEADCVSAPSYPASELHFFINGQKVIIKKRIYTLNLKERFVTQKRFNV